MQVRDCRLLPWFLSSTSEEQFDSGPIYTIVFWVKKQKFCSVLSVRLHEDALKWSKTIG